MQSSLLLLSISFYLSESELLHLTPNPSSSRVKRSLFYY